jgi:hypothetical protein
MQVVFFLPGFSKLSLKHHDFVPKVAQTVDIFTGGVILNLYGGSQFWRINSTFLSHR